MLFALAPAVLQAAGPDDWLAYADDQMQSLVLQSERAEAYGWLHQAASFTEAKDLINISAAELIAATDADDPDDVSATVTWLVMGAAARGDQNDAHAYVDMLKTDDYRAAALAKAAIIAQRNDDFSAQRRYTLASLNAVSTSARGGDRAWASSQIASALDQAGEHRAAMLIAATCEDDELRGRLVATLGSKPVALTFHRQLEAIKAKANIYDRLAGYARRASGLAETFDEDQLIVWVGQLPTPLERGVVACVIAEHLALTGR